MFEDEVAWGGVVDGVHGNEIFGDVTDFVFLFDILLKSRTSYTDHGYDVLDQRKIMRKYLHSWFAIDLVPTRTPRCRICAPASASPSASASLQVSGLPFGLIGKAVSVKKGSSDFIRLFNLIRLLRIGRLLRRLSSLSGANYIRIVQVTRARSVQLMSVVCRAWPYHDPSPQPQSRR